MRNSKIEFVLERIIHKFKLGYNALINFLLRHIQSKLCCLLKPTISNFLYIFIVKHSNCRENGCKPCDSVVTRVLLYLESFEVVDEDVWKPELVDQLEVDWDHGVLVGYGAENKFDLRNGLVMVI